MSYQALMTSIGLNFTFYRPARNLLEILSNIEDFSFMITDFESKSDKKSLTQCVINANAEKEKLMNHPYRGSCYKNQYETELYSPSRDEERALRAKIDSSFNKINFLLERAKIMLSQGK
jgi:hypothetical protein